MGGNPRIKSFNLLPKTEKEMNKDQVFAMCIIACGFHLTLSLVPFCLAAESLLYGKAMSGNPIDNIKERGWKTRRKGLFRCLELLLSVRHLFSFRHEQKRCRKTAKITRALPMVLTLICTLTGGGAEPLHVTSHSAKRDIRLHCLLLKHCFYLVFRSQN